MTAVRTIVVDGEGLAMPASLREALGIKPGDAVLVETQAGELRIPPESPPLRRLQRRLGKYAVEGRYLSDELLVERRAETVRGD